MLACEASAHLCITGSRDKIFRNVLAWKCRSSCTFRSGNDET
jgi:hypothetical protein